MTLNTIDAPSENRIALIVDRLGSRLSGITKDDFMSHPSNAYKKMVNVMDMIKRRCLPSGQTNESSPQTCG